MTAGELEELIKSGQTPVLLDVRSSFEYKAGHIRRAVHTPLSNVLKATKAASKNKDDLLLLICEHGLAYELNGESQE